MGQAEVAQIFAMPTTRKSAKQNKGGAASSAASHPSPFVFGTTSRKRYEFPTHINELVVDRANASCSEVFVVVIRPADPPTHASLLPKPDRFF